jgi:hypothetical protein
MAGTIVIDRIESDASYTSTINVANRITFSNTVNFGVFAGTAPVAGFYLPTTNNLAFTTASTERMRIDSDGDVLIGATSAAAGKLVVKDNSAGNNLWLIGRSSDGTSSVSFRNNADSAYNARIECFDTGTMTFATGTSATERARINSSGNVGIGTSSPAARLDATTATAGFTAILTNTNGASDSNGLYIKSGTVSTEYNLRLSNTSGSTDFMVVKGDGNVGIGIASPTVLLHLQKNNAELFIDGGSSAYSLTSTLSFARAYIKTTIVPATPSGDTKMEFATQSSGTTAVRMTINNSGNVVIAGSLSKGSGSFRIEHPLPQLAPTHELVHSFIEGPQADLIYRGKVSLVSGIATVNIDAASTMTEGTFVALCRDVQCFTTNESDWTAVRGSVSGNILTIEAQDSASTASISWMVIGERQDKHMYDTDWTDESGKVIVEPLKEALENR